MIHKKILAAISLAACLVCVVGLLGAAKPEIDVVKFGAIPDDGGDDTLAIQKAIDEAEANAIGLGHAVRVVFPRGVYNFTTLTIDGANIELVGYGARLEQILGSGYNQAIYVKGEVDSGDAEYVTFRGLTVDCNYPSIDSAGSGIGFNIRADNVYLQDVTCENTEDGTFISAFCLYTTFDHCVSRSAGRSAFRPRGDFQKLIHCEAHDWNAVNAASGNRAILADGQEIDADDLYVDDFYAHISIARQVTDCILVDCGDGDAAGSNTLSCGNSGQATQVNGKAAWTIDAGHGFAPGDGFKIQESGVSAYDSETTASGMMHKVLSVTGEVFVYVVDANTLKLYTTAADAKLNAGNSTNRYDLTDSGTGTFYIKSYGGRKRAFTVASTVDDTITCTGHGFHTGRAARLTVGTGGVDVLPAGLANVALITTNTDYTTTGSNALYWRNKRINNVTLRNVRVVKEAPTVTDSAVCKVNNVNNLLVDRFLAGQTPWDSVVDADDECFRIGAGTRKVTILNSVFPNGFVNNTRSWIPELEIAHCELGTEEYIPVDACSTLQVGKLHFHHNKVRFSHAALQGPATVLEFRDSDCDGWDVHDNLFEAHSTGVARILDMQQSEHFGKSGLLKFWNNERRNAGTSTAPYGGLSFTASTSDTITASAHCLFTGDEVYVATTGTLPTGLTANTKYFVRRTGDSTLTLHTDRPGATDNTNRVDITSAAGSGTHTIHGPRNVGCFLAFSTVRDRSLMQYGSTGKQFVGVTAPTNVNFEWQAGDIIWQMNPIPGGSPGWVCTKTGVRGTTAATFEPMPAGARTFSIVTYGARADDAVDDTTAVQAAIDAAEAYTAANAGSDAEVIVPAGVFLVGSGISAGSGAVEIGGAGVSNYVTMRGEGCLKLYPASSADAVVELVGDHCRLEGIHVDGNASGSPAGRGEGVRVSGSYNRVVDVIAQNTKTTGSTGTTFMVFGSPAYNNVFERCTSISAGYFAFDNRGKYTTFRDITLLEFASHGFSQAGQNTETDENEVTIDGFYASSTVSTQDCMVIDESYTTDSSKTGYKLNRLKLSNATMIGGASMAAGMKLARINHAMLDRVSVIHTATGYSSLKLAEAIGRLEIRNCFFSRDINQDPSPTDPTGAISATASNGGFAQFTSASHDVKTGDYIVMRGTTNYNGLQMVTAANSTTFTTTKKYVAADSSGNFYSVIGSINIRDTVIGDRVQSGFSGSINGVRASRLKVENCSLLNYENFAIGLDSAIQDLGVFDEISIKGVSAESYDNSTAPFFLAWDTGQGNTVVNTGIGYIRIEDVDIQDRGSVATSGMTGVSRKYDLIATNTTLSGTDTGKVFNVDAANLVITLPKSENSSGGASRGVGSGVVYTFVLGVNGLSAGTGLTLNIDANDKFMGNGFTPSDGKDCILAGATDREGDAITIMSDGDKGWLILNVTGTWSREP